MAHRINIACTQAHRYISQENECRENGCGLAVAVAELNNNKKYSFSLLNDRGKNVTNEILCMENPTASVMTL